MADKKKIINEAAAELEAIKKFAEEEAVKELQKQIKPKLKEQKQYHFNNIDFFGFFKGGK